MQLNLIFIIFHFELFIFQMLYSMSMFKQKLIIEIPGILNYELININFMTIFLYLYVSIFT